jgi:hypothetical protein
MSIIQNIRLIVAQNLNTHSAARHTLVNFLHELDMELDREGYVPSKKVEESYRKFEAAFLDLDDVRGAEEVEEDDVDFIDIDDIDLVDPDTEDL